MVKIWLLLQIRNLRIHKVLWNSPLVTLFPTGVTRFGYILSLWKKFKSLWQNFEGLFSIWQNLLWQILYAIGHIFIV